MTMNHSIRNDWVAALRSGRYQQGKAVLHNVTDDAYDALGVLCDLAVRAGVPVEVTEGKQQGADGVVTFAKYDGDTFRLPVSVQSWAGVDDVPLTKETGVVGDSLSINALNDLGWTFSEIADVIERDL